MFEIETHKEFKDKGYFIFDTVFSKTELNELRNLLKVTDGTYAIRQLLEKYPKVNTFLFRNDTFKKMYDSFCGSDYFISKAIYFNKPAKSNWFVSYHQDVSISAKKRIVSKDYTQWTNKQGQLGVIPPIDVLESTITFRIHLDDTNHENGALKVLPKSHTEGLVRIDENFDENNYENEFVCKVKEGGVMLMKPLLLHASDKSISEKDRAVIHIEFCNKEIPTQWLEKKEVV
ncbi:Phytanoyl-CoA dioxygenase (PhyH) [Tenacibaculum sp. MAR_2009_124]|uniref:phytanoyl-CoA dioxygenase family protein n=1 Tax=Tenacibaculum sp. MAR_2009_124 TaxID=1250059 RepID=UPI00089B8B36|nr:phytanoyl-CoA dioxygenase family protein [Tenacibaculum sp. MAR_2009_124]SEC86599.1 Phytanoyl-CoA dioxygenase (PhyH) [Tenacibaculum sp. MAR_2009_124]